MGSILALLGLVLSFILALALKDAAPFTTVGALAVGGKWMENTVERWRESKDEG